MHTETWHEQTTTSRRRHRFARAALSGTAALGLAGGLVAGGLAVGTGTAEAATTDHFGPGTYTVLVPGDVAEVDVDLLGGAGFPGDPSTTGLSAGGAAGSGTRVTARFPVGAGHLLQAGQTITLVVGAKGGGGHRGYGRNLGGAGGNGGGASYLEMPGGAVLAVAGGGGGGGGGGGAYYDYVGGSGGTLSPGQSTGDGVATAARGGEYGGRYNCSPGTGPLGPGEDGESTGTSSSSGGGGGGGGAGWCGGQGGGSGDHGSGGSAGGQGGGGGGAGGSMIATAAPADGAGSITAGSNASGDGSGSATVAMVPSHPVVATPVDFGAQAVATTSSPRPVDLTNDGVAPVTFQTVSMSGPDAGEFDVVGTTCPSPLAAGASCQVSIAFTPTGPGPRTAVLHVYDDAPDGSVTVDLSGSGTQPPTVTPTPVAFADVSAGGSDAAQTVTLHNDQDVPLTMQGSPAVAVRDATGDFTVTGDTCTGQTLPAFGSCTVEVAFTPLSTSRGPVEGTLAFTDDAGNSPQLAPLQGTALAPPTGTLDGDTTFAPVLAGGSSAPQVVQLANAGPGALQVGAASDTPPGVLIAGPDAQFFRLTADSCSGQSVPDGQSCQLQVEFTPPSGSAPGTRTATLQVSGVLSDGPLTATLTGTIAAPPTATLAASGLDFGTAAVGSSGPPRLVTLTNDGDVGFDLYGLALSGDGSAFSGDFGTCAGVYVLQPHQSCAVGARFLPTTTGPVSATLYIEDTAGNAPQTLALTGVGATVPDAPVIGSAVAGDHAARVSFTPPASDGGSPVTGYTVTASPGGATATGTASPITVGGLTPGTAYTFTVTATNAVGTGPASAASGPATPTATTALSGKPPAGGVGEPYSFAFTVTGSPAPTVGLSSGTLPHGLKLSPTGALTGTPTTAGTYRFVVVASGPAGSATKSVSVTIRPRPTITIADASRLEGNSGTSPLTFRVTLSRVSTVPVTVRWATANSSATAPSDYTAASGTVTFAPGQTVGTLTVQVRGDRAKEGNESFLVVLGHPSKATIADGKATGGIRNDD